eukprot:1737535-Pyramimonas_sp.AAC.2
MKSLAAFPNRLVAESRRLDLASRCLQMVTGALRPAAAWIRRQALQPAAFGAVVSGVPTPSQRCSICAW